MNANAALSRLLPSLETGGNLIRATWDRLQPLPGGDVLFSRFIGVMVPYSGSIGARIVELRPRYVRVTLKDRRAVRNHLRCIHAIALVNLAEIAGNILVGYNMADDARFIVKGIDIEYLKKARGTIEAISDIDVPTTKDKQELKVPVRLLDSTGNVVARATLHTLLGPKK